MFLPPYPTPMQGAGRLCLHVFTGLVFVFLLAPILVIIPLSFNGGTFLTYPLDGVSLRWYADFFLSGSWLPTLWNSVIAAAATTAIATPLGTLAAFGLVRLNSNWKPVILGVLVAPMIVPVIIIAIATYFAFAPLGLTGTMLGLVLVHTVLAAPFVVIVVHATLQGFDPMLWRAGTSLGAPPATVFIRVVLPLIAPGVLSGALFGFVTSFDEVVTTMLLAGPAQQTLPLRMFDGVREQISPTITAAATVLIVVSVVLLGMIELLRRRVRHLQAKRA